LGIDVVRIRRPISDLCFHAQDQRDEARNWKEDYKSTPSVDYVWRRKQHSFEQPFVARILLSAFNT